MFMRNCIDNYEPSHNCTIDEQLVSFRGRCSFRIYMKNKPDKYGLKILMLNDSEHFYMVSAIPYVGKVTPQNNDSVPTYFVRKLVEMASITETWRTLTMDNWFTSVPLFEKLKKERQLRAVGTIRKNKKEIPSTLKIATAVDSSRFVFTPDLTLVSYVPKKKQEVFLLSSVYHNTNINATTNKPQIIMDYNACKGATDTFDEKCHIYSVARRTKRWPLKFFYNMLNQASINSCVLYNLQADNPILSRSKFIKNLAMSLVEPHLRRRLEMQRLRHHIRKIISKLLRVDVPAVQ
ncbi:piggyBac transposable element-derived protein 4-like [Harpegnathos saltator]|uniref:piggyBac transposable element-derived protein 4-like n=1 Tax=Harpegnathos saltator TaxID=610380 RepID=UPI000DBEE9D3|nr:piggyBac transposable element-derived protein 4-like [Harpegnathos saltator]